MMMKSFAMAQHTMASHGLLKPRTFRPLFAAATIPKRNYSELTIPKNKMDLNIVHIDSH